MKRVFIALTFLAAIASACTSYAGDPAKSKKAGRGSNEKPALFIPFLGKPNFPTTAKPVVDARLTLPIYQGLPDKPYRVIGDIYVPTRPNAAQAIDDAMTLAVSKGADGLIVASDHEVHAQQIKGEGTLSPDLTYFRAWTFKWTDHASEVLPTPRTGAVELSATSQASEQTAQPLRVKTRNDHQTDLRNELVENARRIEWAQQGVIPAGFSQREYLRELRNQEAQILADLQATNP